MIDRVLIVLRFVRAMLKGMFNVLACGVSPTLMRVDIRTQDGLGLDWRAIGKDVYHGVKHCNDKYGKKRTR